MIENSVLAKVAVHKAGLRWTKQRQALWEILMSSLDHYLEIREIDARLRHQYPGISHNTIYRNLQEFKDLQLVEMEKGTNGLTVKVKCDTRHHHHFICQRCGRVQEIQMPRFDAAFYQKQLPGAKITGHSFELYGYCAQCQRAMREKS